MNQSKIENVQPEQVTNNELEADSQQVSPSIANALVVGSLFGQREIKFKYIFQHEETGRMCSIVFDYLQIFNGECKAQCERLTGYFIVAKCQYTGLKDKNGEKIYEGDILKRDNSKYTFRIEYYAPRFMLHVNEYDLRNQLYEMSCLYDCQIIGNIFENPELLHSVA